MRAGGLPVRLLWWLLPLVLFAACMQEPAPPAPTQPRVAPKTEAAALLALGESRLALAKPRLASDAFAAALRLPLEPVERAQAYYGLARADLEQDKPAAALDWLDKLFSKSPVGQPAVQGALLAGKVHLQQGQPQKAASRLRRLLARPPARLTPNERYEAKLLLAEALVASGEAGAATAALMELAAEDGYRHAGSLAEPLAQAAAKASAYELEPLVASAARPEIRSALLVGLAQAYMSQGRLDEAERVLSELRATPAAARWHYKISDLDRRLNQARLVMPRTVGVVVPLSGPYAQVGRQVLAAIQLGLGLFGAGSAHPPTLYIEDSAGDAAAAAQAVTRLVQQRRVMAIIGPLAAAPALAAARRAQQLATPIITLTRVPGVTRAGEFVFQNTLSPSQQAGAVLRRVVVQENLSRVAVLAPENAYGKGWAQLIAQMVAVEGGSLVRTIYYHPSQTDFKSEIKRLVSLPPGSYRPGRPDSPKPVIDFDAVYLPDGPKRAGMIAPQLEYWDVTGVQIMGTSRWHNPSLLRIAGRYLNGCVFPDAFNPASPQPQVSRFVRDFTAALGRQPNLLEAQAFDAAALVRRLMDDPMPPRLRGEFRSRLESLSHVPGVCGPLSIGPQRQVKAPVELFTISRGDFAPYQGPPALPANQREAAPAAELSAGPGSPATAAQPQPLLRATAIPGVYYQDGQGGAPPAQPSPAPAPRPAPAGTILR